jgi:uncharacterized protein (TIGR02246 family)
MTLAAYVRAFQARDAGAVAGLFTEDGALIDAEGNATRGRAAIRQQYAESFGASAGLKAETALESIRFLTADVAQIEGTAKVTTSEGMVSSVRFSALGVRNQGQWRIAELRDYPGPKEDTPPAERTAELDWLIGDWVDESAGSKVTSSIRWGDGKAFLVRTYGAHIGGRPAHSGVMIIGWDPRTSQLKSWSFDSEGGLGEGYWTRVGDDQWIVKAQGSLRDGSATSATQTITRVNKDAMKFTSTDRVIGGEFAPDIDEIVMVRRPPAPGGAATAAPRAPAPAAGLPAPGGIPAPRP